MLRRNRCVSRIKVLRSGLGYVTTTVLPFCAVWMVRVICRPFWLTSCLEDRTAVTELLKRCGFSADAAWVPNSMCWFALGWCGLFMQLSLQPITANGHRFSFLTQCTWNQRFLQTKHRFSIHKHSNIGIICSKILRTSTKTTIKVHNKDMFELKCT